MAEIIYTDGTTKETEPNDGLKFQYEEVTKIVDGYIEIVDLRNGKLLIINEEGKLYDLDFNRTATKLAHDAGVIAASDYIAGDALLCEFDEID